jgi:hypothetical protein
MSRNGVVEIYWYLTSGIPLDSFIRTAAKGSSLLGICSDIFQRIRVQHAQLVSFVNLTMLPILQIFIFTCCSQLVLLDLQLSEKKKHNVTTISVPERIRRNFKRNNFFHNQVQSFFF